MLLTDNSEIWLAKENFANDKFSTWFGYPIYCVPNSDVITLNGTDDQMVTNNLVLQVRKCSDTDRNPKDLPCKSDDEIKAYIDRLQVNTWVNQDKFDSTQHTTVPIERSEQKVHT